MMDETKSTEGAAVRRRGGFLAVGIVAVLQAVATVVILAAADYPSARILLAITLGAAVVLLGSSTPESSGAATARAVLSVLLFGGIMASVGGAASPMSPLLFHVVVGQALRKGFDRSVKLTLATAALVVVALSLAPRPWFGPEIEEPHLTLLWGIMLVGVLFTHVVMAAAQRTAHDVQAAQLGRMRETILADNAARVRGLETMGAKVAHELKNPLTSIKSLLQMLGKGVEDERRQRRFGVLSHEVARMQTILQEYLTFSRPLDELRTEDIDLGSVVEHVAAVQEARAADAGVRLKVAAPAMRVTGDEGRLRAALLNLVGNAIEATPSGGTVSLELARTERGARLRIRDTGAGMTEAQLAKVGSPFFTTKSSGTGLGVVIASATVRQHGGDIAYASAEGEGTTVTIDLPSEAPPSEGPAVSRDELSHMCLKEIIASKLSGSKERSSEAEAVPSSSAMRRES